MCITYDNTRNPKCVLIGSECDLRWQMIDLRKSWAQYLVKLAHTLNMPPGAPIAMENFDITFREANKTIFGHFIHEWALLHPYT